MLRYLIISFLFIISAFLSADAQIISGKVRDSKTKSPLSGVNITLKGTSHGTITDANGSYSIDLNSVNKPILIFSYIGYQPQEVGIELGQKIFNLSLKPDDIIGETVEVNAYRVDENSAIAFQTLSAEKIKSNNLGQDIPYLLNQSASVVATSNSGNGVGYSGLRIRGVDPARINVTINGVPWNDAESHGMYWVDLPDLAASVDNIQLQRGIGTSTNGSAAFGATIDLQTFSFNPEPHTEFSTSFGSYLTNKNSYSWGSGLLNSGWIIDGRLSTIKSDGYVDRGWSDLKSIYISASNYGEYDVLQFNFIRGEEKTYQSWLGVSESDLKINRRLNYYSYDNQTDNYVQNHYQMHYKYSINKDLNLNLSFFLIRGAGFYEEFREKDALLNYGMEMPVDSTSNIIRRKWLDNAYYGSLFSMDYQISSSLKSIYGGGITNYTGDHYGEVIWAEYFVNRSFPHRYYNDTGVKKDLNLYTKFIYDFDENKTFFIDLQFRKINYEFYGFGSDFSQGNQVDDLNFFNPKIGLTWQYDKNLTTYVFIGKGSKEPTRDEYVLSTPESRPKPETMIDVETGMRSSFGNSSLNVNIYFMNYDNQLILTGELNDVGAPVRKNVPKSYRLGIETEYGVKLLDNLDFETNLTLSTSSISEFTDAIWDDDNKAEIKTIYKDKPIAYSPQIIHNALIRYLIHDYVVELSTKYVGKQFLDNTGSNSKKLDSYFLTDFKLKYEFIDENNTFFRVVQITFAMNNVFNQLYSSDGYTSSYISGKELLINNYYYPQAERNVMIQARFSL